MSRPNIASSSIDYLTLTSLPSSEEGEKAIISTFSKLSKGIAGDIDRWQWYGYKGRSVKGLCAGVRHDGAIIRGSGKYGDLLYDGIPKRTGVRCTRIDLQVTVETEKRERGRAERIFDHVESSDSNGRRGKPPKATLIKGGKTSGDTVYIGSRKSDRFCRVYDKYAESGFSDSFRNQWRYETELKGDRARNLWVQVVTGKVDVHADILGLVKASFASVGVEVPWEADDVIIPNGRVRDIDDERRLKWIEAQVAPSIRALATSGLYDDLTQVLMSRMSLVQVEAFCQSSLDYLDDIRPVQNGDSADLTEG